MTTQYTPILKLALPVTGELSGTWGDVVNDNITSMVEQAIAGLATISTWSANAHTLSTANGTTSESRCAMLVAQDGAGLSASGEIVCPASSKLYVLKNATSYQITLKTASGTGVAVASGNTAFLFCDGTNVNACVTTIVDGRVTGNLTVDGNATINGNTALGNATSDTITATARFASGLIPSADNTYDLGSTANSWKDLYIDGTATMALVAISGGTINGVSIGGTTPATFLAVDNLSLDGNTIASTNTNGNIVIAPNGTGDVQLDADTVRVGDSGAAATLTSNGAGALTVTTGGAADLTLSTNSGTNSGTITIANGANGNITLTPNGTGDVILSADTTQIGDANTDATLTTNGTGNLNLTTNNGTNSGTIQIAQGANGNITLTPNGTGSVSISKLYVSGTAQYDGNLTIGNAAADTLTINSTITSNLIFTDDTYDIGASGATRPRNLYLSRKLGVNGALVSSSGITVQAESVAGNGLWVINDSTLNYGQVYFGGSYNSGWQGIRADGRSNGYLALFTQDTSRLNVAYNGDITFQNGTLYEIAGTAVGAPLSTMLWHSGYSTTPQFRFMFNHPASGVWGIGSNGTSSMIFGIGTSNGSVSSTLATLSPGGSFSTSNDSYFYGVQVGRGNNAVSTNTAVGVQALAAVGAAAGAQTAVGYYALTNVTTGSDNTALGYRAGYTLGAGVQNVFLGRDAGYAITSGSYNTIIGFGSGPNTGTAGTGSNNTVVGFQSLAYATSAANNTSLGYRAGRNITTAFQNVAIGDSALYSNNSGNYNTIVGMEAGYNMSGSGNTFVGHQTGYNVTTGTRNIFLGSNAAVTYPAGFSMLAGSGNMILGNFSGNATVWGTTLDIRNSNDYIVLATGSQAVRLVVNGSGEWGINQVPQSGITMTVSGPLYSNNNGNNCYYMNSGGSYYGTIQNDSNNVWSLGYTSTLGSLGTPMVQWNPNYTRMRFSGNGNYLELGQTNEMNMKDSSGAVADLYINHDGGRVYLGTGGQIYTNSAGTNIVMPNGGGIDFSATSQGSGATSELLNDYEEGTWTPVFNLIGTLTHGSQSGYYTKVGNRVFCTVYVSVTSTNTTQDGATMSITGLPFTAANVVQGTACALTEYMGGTYSTTSPTTFHVAVNGGTASVNLNQNNYNGQISAKSWFTGLTRNGYSGGTMYVSAQFSYSV